MDDSYAAGLIDGEGYIGILLLDDYPTIRVSVTMTDKGLPALEGMQATYGGSLRKERDVKGPQREAWNWRLNGSRAVECLLAVRPFLRVKGGAADLALELRRLVDSAARHPNGKAVWTAEMHARARMLKARIQDFNRRGPDPEPPALPPGRPLAIRRWGWWWEPDDDLFGPVEFEGRFPTSGRMIAGHVYATPDPEWPESSPGLLPTPTATSYGSNQSPSPGAAVRPSLDSLASSGTLLPTPAARLGISHGSPSLETARRRMEDEGRRNLEDAVALLPTPTASDSDRTSDTYARGNPTLQGALLATPRVSASRTSRSAALRSDSMSSPSLEQCIEIANGVLPREFTTWDELPPSWHGARTVQPFIDGD